MGQRWVGAALNLDSRGFNGRFLTIKLITSSFNLLLSVSERVQRPKVQIFYLLTGWAEEAVRDVNVYGNHKNEKRTHNRLLVSMVTSNAHTSPDSSHPADLQASTARDEYLEIKRNESAGKSQPFHPPAR